jgi:hypothetical protein
MLGASAQAIAPATKIVTPISSGARRPMRSDSGPQNSCPTPNPAKNAASVAVTDPCGACSPRAIAGRLGRYMSTASGPSAVRLPSSNTNAHGAFSVMGVRAGEGMAGL